MSGKPAARQGDATSCPKSGHKDTAIIEGSSDVFFNGLPAVRMGDKTSCGSEIVGQVIPNVLINGKPAVVMGSTGSHGDVVIGGSGDILIGNNVVIGSGIVFGGMREGGERVSKASGTVFGAASLAQPLPSRALKTLKQKHNEDSVLEGDLYSEYEDEDEDEDEEEEIELEVEQRITLQIGVFFDGTGNNETNTVATEQCRAQDLSEYPPDVMQAITQMCRTHGYRDTNGDGIFNQLPDSSYGNALSNVAKLKRAYRDDATSTLSSETSKASFAVYIDGIGTTAGEDDSTWGLASGSGATGVTNRVIESGRILDRIAYEFAVKNPQIVIEAIEFDVFGFSRGAAAARHFVNEILKPEAGSVGAGLASTRTWLADGFSHDDNISVNFVGIFDTVAGIVDLKRGDFDPGNAANSGVNLYLPPGCAKKVVHVTAADERRHNFSLNRVHESHFEVSVPGVHSDIGGGYHAVSQENLLVDRPRVIYQNHMMSTARIELTKQWKDREDTLRQLQQSGLPGNGSFAARQSRLITARDQSLNRPDTILYLAMSREVRGDLSKVALNIMHKMAVDSGAMLRDLENVDTTFPSDLAPIADKIIVAAINGRRASLTTDEMQLLTARYIHMSANWTTTQGILVNRPRASGRAIYPDRPQRGYPE